MKFGEIQSNEFLDIYRIESGSLLYVKKYKRDPNHNTLFYNNDFRKSTKVVKGCKGLRQLKSDYTYHDYFSDSNKTVHAGSYVLNDTAIVSIQPREFTFEIKSNEGFGGTIERMEEILKEVREIILSYSK